jgi:hypothetical protein
MNTQVTAVSKIAKKGYNVSQNVCSPYGARLCTVVSLIFPHRQLSSFTSHLFLFFNFLPDCDYAARLSLTSHTHRDTREVADGTWPLRHIVTLTQRRASRILSHMSVALRNRSRSPAL